MAKSKKTDTTTINNMEDLAAAMDLPPEKPVMLEIPGVMLSITFHDASLAEDSFVVCSTLQGLADKFQGMRISAEDIVSSLEEQEQRNLHGVIDPATGEMTQAPKVDVDSGLPIGLNANQQILMDKLEDQLDGISYIMSDLEAAFKVHNDNPQFKLLYRTDAERRRSKAEYAARQSQDRNTEAAASLDAQREQREQRRAERAARANAQH